MPSPQAMRQAISGPDVPCLKPSIYTRIESILLMALCIFIGFILPLMLRSSFDGVWFKTDGDPSAPAEIKLLAHRDKFSEVIPVNCFGSYETVTLIADGREHAWSEPAGGCHLAFDSAIKSYSARMTQNAVRLNMRTGSASAVESWTLIGHGRMVVTQSGQAATYRRASWLRSLFTEEP